MKDKDAIAHGLRPHALTSDFNPDPDESLIAAMTEIKRLEDELAAARKANQQSQQDPHAELTIGHSQQCNVHPDSLDLRVDSSHEAGTLVWVPCLLYLHPKAITRQNHANESYTIQELARTRVRTSYCAHELLLPNGERHNFSLTAYATVSANPYFSPVEAQRRLQSTSPSPTVVQMDPDDLYPSDPSNDNGDGSRDQAPFIPSEEATASTEQRPQDDPGSPHDPQGHARRP